MSRTKILVAIGASSESLEGLKHASGMGLRLVVVDANPNAPGMSLADHRAVVSTYDGDAIVNWLNDHHIKPDGVIAMCADVPVSVAIVASAFNLSGMSVDTATCLGDKILMKKKLAAKNIPIPRYFSIPVESDMEAIANQLGYPFIIKPVDSRGARGVQLLEHSSQLVEAYRFAKKVSPTGRVMAEEYLAGPQISTETLIDGGKCYTLGFSDRNYEWLTETKPWIIENGGDAPSSLTLAQQQAVTTLAEKAGLALGIETGVAKGDMVLTREGPKVIEMAGRLSGGYFSTTQIPIATGVNFVEHAIRLALGEHLDANKLRVSARRGVAIRYLRLPGGKVTSINRVEKARRAPGVRLLNLSIKTGDRLGEVTNHVQRAGLVVCEGNSKQQAIERCLHALSLIEVTMELDHG